ncbi:Uncharacterised protein [Mycobacteroides abscessus subsp. massiliense]|nr:Uncharacterised protein [Mycobacteroides abscessus subsp. massiliense]
MVGNGATSPIVLCVQLCRCLDLLCYVLNYCFGHFEFLEGESRFVLEKLKQNSKPQPSLPRLIADLLHFVGKKRKMLN